MVYYPNTYLARMPEDLHVLLVEVGLQSLAVRPSFRRIMNVAAVQISPPDNNTLSGARNITIPEADVDVQ